MPTALLWAHKADFKVLTIVMAQVSVLAFVLSTRAHAREACHQRGLCAACEPNSACVPNCAHALLVFASVLGKRLPGIRIRARKSVLYGPMVLL